MSSLTLKERLWHVAAMIALPLAILSLVLLTVLTPGRDPGSGFGVAWPYMLALGAGAPFAWRLAPPTILTRVGAVILYVLCGILALTFFWMLFNCARGLCP
jgi:hypothetical protein